MATRNERVRVRSSDTAVGTRVHAPSALPVDDRAARQAEALQRALGVGMKAYADVTDRRHRKAVLIGTQAALEGRELTEEERKRDSLLLGYESVRTDREIVDLRNRATALYQNSPNKADPAALQAELDGLYSEMFGGLDPEVDLDRAKFHQVRGAWGAIVETINETAAADAAQLLQDNLENDLTILSRDEYANTGRIDWDKLHDTIMQTAKVSGTRANEIMAATARDIAETNADPELIDSIPDNWANGDASFKSVPRFADALSASRRAAENQRRYNDERAEREAVAALKATQAANAASIVGNIIGGRSQKERVGQLVFSGGLTSEDAMALVRFESSDAGLGTADGTGRVDHGFVTALEVGLYTGEITQSDIIANLDLIGNGKDGGAAISRLMALSKSVLDDKLQTPEAKDQRSILAAEYNPLQSDLALDLNGTQHRAEKTHQARALFTYNQYVLSGMEPVVARQKVREEFPPLEPDTAGARLTEAQIDAKLTSGEINEAEAIRLYSLIN